MPETQFQGKIVFSVTDAVKYIGATDLEMWTIKPGNTKYISKSSDCRVGWNYTDGYCVKDKEENYFVKSNIDEFPWTKITPKGMSYLNGNVFRYSYSHKPYNWLTNNCQHFALDMYDKAQSHVSCLSKLDNAAKGIRKDEETLKKILNTNC